MILAGITFRQFLALYGALAGATVLIFLFLHRHRGKEVSSILIWKRVTGSRRSIWHDLASLLLQLIFLFLATFALTDPRLPPEKGASRHVVLVLDSSASMGARYGETTRIDEARRRAGELLARLGKMDRVMAIAAGADLVPLTTLTDGFGEVRAALAKVVPRAGEERLGEGIEYGLSALALMGEKEPAEGRVILFTDRPRDLAKYADRQEAKVEQLVVADPQQNLGITAFDVRKTFNLTPGYEVLVRVANFGYGSATATLELATSQTLVGRAEVAVDSRQEIQRVYYLPFGVAGKLRARLTGVAFGKGADGLAADDAAYAWLPPRRPLQVLLVTERGLFLEKALAANPQVVLRRVAPAGYSDGAASAADLVVLDNFTPSAPPRSNAFYVNPSGSGSPFAVAKSVDKPVFSGWDANHPLLKYVVLKDLNVPKANVLTPRAGDANLIGTLDGSLLLAREQGGRVQIGLGFDLEHTDLPLRVAFPVLMHNLVTWLSEAKGIQEPVMVKVGETAEIRVQAAGQAQVDLQTPDGETLKLPVQEGSFAFRPDRPGFYGYRDGAEARPIPASFLLPDESDLLAGVGQATEPPALAAAASMNPGKTYWSLLILAALLLLLLDWVLLHYGRIT